MRMINPADVRFEPMAEKYLPQVLEIYDYYIRNTTVTFHINPLSLEEMRALVFHKNPGTAPSCSFMGMRWWGTSSSRPTTPGRRTTAPGTSPFP